MAEEGQSQSNFITVHQCLFGYDDGHRLLASSTKLLGDAHSLLLLLSDLVPGIKLSEVGSYWTGIPLREAKQYALMQTWPAPEMSRPGCVWTHAVIVGFADIARFTNLSILRNLTARPVAPGQYEGYSTSIRLAQAEISPPVNSGNGRPAVNPSLALRLIRTVYSGRHKPDVEARPNEFDEALFALWSQQWPRLRRSFAFRTAASKLEGTYPGARFDVRLVISSENMPVAMSEPLSDLKPWETVTIEDICSTEPTAFRRFLWRYGSDLTRGRDRFRVLADLYLKSRLNVLEGKNLNTALEMVAKKIPAPLDGLTLKQDLVSCGWKKFSLLPPGDVVDTLTFFVSHPEIEGLPLPPIEACSAIQQFWPSRANDILMLAEQAAEQYSELGNAILNNLALVAEPTSFLELTKDKPSIRQRLIPLNPTLLISKELAEIPQPELSHLLALIPDDHPDIAYRLLNYLLCRDDADIAREMWHRFPKETLEATIKALRLSIDENGPGLLLTWHRELELRRSLLLNAGIIESAQSTHFLAALAALLGHDSFEVMKVGAQPWVAALQTAQDNVEGYERKTFLAFLLAIAIRYPVTGSELIFERAFESVHNDIWNSRLPWDGFAILKRHLPDIGLFSNWDNCKRLRIAVVSAYVDGNLDPMSFCRLTKDKRLWDNLIDLAGETSNGRRFLRRISA